MRARLLVAIAVGGTGGVARLLCAQTPAVQQAPPPVTVADIIAMTTIGSMQHGDGDADYDVVSQDGAHVAVVVKRGNVDRNTVDYRLLVFRTADLLHTPKPDTVLTFASSSNRPAIGQLKWLADNATLMFLGERPGQLPQLYTINTVTHALVQRTDATTLIRSYSVADRGDPVAYVADEMADTASYVRLRQHGDVVGSPHPNVYKLITGDWAPRDAHRSRWLVVLHGNIVSRLSLADSATGYGTCLESTLMVSPIGDVALIQCHPLAAPMRWARYRQKDYLRATGTGFAYTTYVVVDLQTGGMRPLFDAPVAMWWVNPTWAPDGRSVVIANAMLPLDVADSLEREARATQHMLAEVELRTGAVTVIARRDSLSVVDWDARSKTLALDPHAYHDPADTARLYYRKTAAGWTATRGAITRALVIDEGLNAPPTLAAVDPKTHAHRVVVDPNPALLSAHRFAREEVMHWRSRAGMDVVGGLYWPPDYVPGRRYPLVIQTHGFDSTAFWPDGSYSTGTAAQPMANAGIMVLQVGGMGIADSEYVTPREGPLAAQAIEGAIDHLDSLGLIDRTNVGLEGFSRTCYHVLYLLTHSSYAIAAATLTDGVDLGYVQYLLFGRPEGSANEWELMNGGRPFGAGLATWRERAPGFNLDRLTAPLQLTAITAPSLLEEWEPYAGLLLQGKPAELVYIPDGDHILKRPWERLTSQQGAVDWFRFWLRGYEDPDPAKAAQYARWHQLRMMRDSTEVRAASAAKSTERTD